MIGTEEVKRMLDGEKILFTGATGPVAGPIAKALATGNEVWAAARFGSEQVRGELTDAGIRCFSLDLVSPELRDLPSDFTVVLNFAVVKTNDFERDLAGNVTTLGLLMEHCRKARAFLQCSSTAVYQPNGHRAFVETDPLGDNHRVLPALQTYSITKIAAEAMCRYSAQRWNLPSTIARLNVPYGPTGGWPARHLDMILDGTQIPVHTDAPSAYNPIYQDDLIRDIEPMLAMATVPATTVNWGGDDVVSIEEWCGYLGELVGIAPAFAPTARTIESVAVDVTKLRTVTGPSTVDWREGFRRMTFARRPEAVRSLA
jgi:UDP-glucuronate 4-epimerase